MTSMIFEGAVMSEIRNLQQQIDLMKEAIKDLDDQVNSIVGILDWTSVCLHRFIDVLKMYNKVIKEANKAYNFPLPKQLISKLDWELNSAVDAEPTVGFEDFLKEIGIKEDDVKLLEDDEDSADENGNDDNPLSQGE